MEHVPTVAQTERHVAIRNAWTRKQTKPIAVVVVAVLVLMMSLAKMDLVQVALLRAPKTKLAAKAERHAARFAAMTGAVRIPIIAEQAAGAWNANAPFPERPAAAASVAPPEQYAVAPGTARHVAPRINTVTGMDVARLAKPQCATQTRHAAPGHAWRTNAVIVRTHARKE